MANVVLNNQREDFLDQVANFLAAIQFSKQDDSFIRDAVLRAPGHRMIINGHVMDYPGPSCPIRFIVTPMGQGEFARDIYKFDVFHFAIYADCQFKQDYKYVCGGSYGFYYDELQQFKQFTLTAFKIK